MDFKSLIRWRLKKDSMTEESPERKLKTQIHESIRELDLEANAKQELHIRTEQLSGEELDKLAKEVLKKPLAPREQAQEITETKTEPHHMGEHTAETLTQELFSLANTKPAFRDKKWQANWESINEQVSNLKNERIKRRIRDKAQALLSGEQ